MDFDKEKIKKLSTIAKIKLSEDKKYDLQIIKDLELISQWAKKINKLDTYKVAPLLTMSKEINVLRDDEPNYVCPKIEELLENASEKDSNYFRVNSYLEN